jgi:ABC-type nitrate/sulfonate/bicarbonate transport system permease component
LIGIWGSRKNTSASCCDPRNKYIIKSGACRPSGNTPRLNIPAGRNPSGRGGGLASAALPLLDDVIISSASRRLASVRPALAPKCRLIFARTLGTMAFQLRKPGKPLQNRKAILQAVDAASKRTAERSGDALAEKSHRKVAGHPEWWLPAALVAALALLWEWQAQTGLLPAIFFPAPSVIAGTLARLLANGELPSHLGATLRRLFLGFVCGGVPGLALGLVMGWSRRVRAVVDPFVAAAHPVPKIAILPLIMIIFGIGESSRVIVISIAAFFPQLISTMAGVRQISPIHFEVAENYGASLGKVFARVVVPGSLPFILAGARLAMNMALLVTVAVELVAAQEGLGAMIWFARETLRTEELYASLLVISVLGIGFNLLFQRLARIHAPWQAEPDN